ncbi:MAG: molybdopterin-synthase adenylyltransferase MoeB [Candidatus Aenigmarchaeota archaeon]|nr:molybdopterin-synthase adenylyltransferase MoeB [Candidatus Aenigmarchaeota archaeon]
MPVKVLIPIALQRFTDKKSSVEVEGKNINEVMLDLAFRFPELRKHIYSEDGNIRSFVNIYLNQEDVRFLQKLETPVKKSDVITIVPSIAGGLFKKKKKLENQVPVGPDSDHVTETQKSENTAPQAQHPIQTIIDGLTDEETKRYNRHIIIPEVGVEGQKQLKRARVLIVGAGGLGCPTSLYLAAAGVGKIGLVDFDVVDHTNLHRQIIFTTQDVGKKKVEAAKQKLKAVNPNVDIILHETKLTSQNAMDIIRNYDIVIDGTDNYPTRYLVNDACVLLGKPNIYGSIFQFDGQASVFDASKGPCYRCLYKEPPPHGLVPSCAEGGVLGILPGIIGLIQATEAIKLILGTGDSLVGRLLLFNALDMSFRELKLRKDPTCPLCGTNKTITQLIDYEQFCGISQKPVEEDDEQINPKKLKELFDKKEDLILVDVREQSEYQICHIEGSKLIPLGQIKQRSEELDKNKLIVLHCHHGGRSMQALSYLKSLGFTKLKNLDGGIDAWADEVEPTMTKY